MVEANYGKCRYLSVNWEFRKIVFDDNLGKWNYRAVPEVKT